jgi:hypothetical protein
MGYLPTIIIHNDAFNEFKKHPEQFGNAIIEGVYKADYEHKQVDVGFNGYANYISVEPSRHADDHTVYVHYVNTISNLNPYNADFEEMVKRNPDDAELFVDVAQGILDLAKNRIKKERKLRKQKMKEIVKTAAIENEYTNRQSA